MKDPAFDFSRKFICNKDVEEAIRSKIQAIQLRIDNEIRQIGGNESGVFVRLSSRSPKDSVQQNLYDLYLEEKKLLLQEGYPDDDVASKIAFTRANVRCLRVHSAREALGLMLNSNRVHEDLQMMVKLTTLPDDATITQIVIRKWEHILPEFEFRAFIFNRKLTALTQYYKTTYVPQMGEQREKLEQLMKNFYSETEHLIPSRILDYVVDYAVDPGSGKIWIVEINTPPPVAGQALFDWDDATDKNVLLGLSPFEFRIITERPADPVKDIRSFLEDEVAKRKKSQKKPIQRKYSV